MLDTVEFFVGSSHQVLAFVVRAGFGAKRSHHRDGFGQVCQFGESVTKIDAGNTRLDWLCLAGFFHADFWIKRIQVSHRPVHKQIDDMLGFACHGGSWCIAKQGLRANGSSE